MSNQKPSIRELIWLARLKQTRLVGLDSSLEGFEWLNGECDDPDCLPWYHKRKECRNEPSRERLQSGALPEDPRT